MTEKSFKKAQYDDFVDFEPYDERKQVIIPSVYTPIVNVTSQGKILPFVMDRYVHEVAGNAAHTLGAPNEIWKIHGLIYTEGSASTPEVYLYDGTHALTSSIPAVTAGKHNDILINCIPPLADGGDTLTMVNGAAGDIWMLNALRLL